MRLIDADKLIDEIKNSLWDWETVNGITASTVLKQTITDINSQPTVITKIPIAGERTDDVARVLKGLEIERECVSRDCDRDCAKCDLVQERDWLLSVYDDAIKMLKPSKAIKPIKKETPLYVPVSYGYDCVCGAPLLKGQPFCAGCGKYFGEDWNDE